jgi:hypothetical protein
LLSESNDPLQLVVLPLESRPRGYDGPGAPAASAGRQHQHQHRCQYPVRFRSAGTGFEPRPRRRAWQEGAARFHRIREDPVLAALVGRMLGP